MTRLRLGGTAALILLLPACATVVRGTREAYVVETEPPGAEATLSTGQRCTTPCALKVARKAGFTVHLFREGYEPVDATVVNETRAGAVAGNIVSGGLLGVGIDASNGSLKSLVPNPLHVKLAAVPPPPAPAPSLEPANPAYTPTDRPVPGAPPPLRLAPAPSPPPAADGDAKPGSAE